MIANHLIESIYPLAPAQQGILFHALHAGALPVYCCQLCHPLRGGEALATALKAAWQQVVDRHPALRTAFFWKQRKEPFQVAARQVKLPWDEQDWRGASPTEREGRLQAYLEADRARGFDLSRPPLLRLGLLRMTDDEYRVVFTNHHLILDGWSAALVLQEASALCQAEIQGRSLDLRRPPPYQQYIAWLRRQDLSAAEAFWRRALEGFAAPTSLGGGPIPLAPAREKDMGQQRAVVPVAFTRGLQAFARRHRVTLNTLFQAAWALLLSRYSGEEDVLFGVVVSGRPTDLPGAESMIGLFVNTLPVRVHIPYGAKILPWLHEVQTQQVELRKYEYSPLVQVQGWSRVPRGLPLFESILAFQNLPAGAPAEGEGGAGGQDVRHFRADQLPAGPGRHAGRPPEAGTSVRPKAVRPGRDGWDVGVFSGTAGGHGG